MRDPLPPSPALRLARPAAALATLLCASLASPARAGDPAASPPAAAAPVPRLAAVETEIRHLEHRLQALRKARTELNAGRPEPAAVEDDARRARESDLRALREIVRYETARAKALATIASTAAGKPGAKGGTTSDAAGEAKAAEARAALEAADRAFLDAMAKIAAARDDGRTDAAKGDAAKGDRPKAEGRKAETGKSDATPPADRPGRERSSAGGDGMPEDDDGDEG